MDNAKIKAVHEYFGGEFPGCSIDDSYDSDRTGQAFNIECGGSDYYVTVSQSFFDDHGNDTIPETLKLFTVAEHLRTLADVRLRVETDGIQMES